MCAPLHTTLTGVKGRVFPSNLRAFISPSTFNCPTRPRPQQQPLRRAKSHTGLRAAPTTRLDDDEAAIVMREPDGDGDDEFPLTRDINERDTDSDGEEGIALLPQDPPANKRTNTATATAKCSSDRHIRKRIRQGRAPKRKISQEHSI